MLPLAVRSSFPNSIDFLPPLSCLRSPKSALHVSPVQHKRVENKPSDADTDADENADEDADKDADEDAEANVKNT